MDAIIGTGKVSKREYEIITECDADVIVSDGVNINVDIIRPDSEKKFPALVTMSSFNKEFQTDRVWPGAARSRRIRGTPDACMEAGPTDFFVRRGYVYIIASSRGTGKSGGAWRWRCLREARDLFDLIEWAAEQPWCDGNVGVQGIGYFVAHAIDVAAMQPPHLKAIAVMSSFFDNYRYFWWKGGILASGFSRWLISLVNMDVHTQESVLKEELGEEGYNEAIARALEDKDLSANPAIVEALKNPDLPTNAALLDVILHPTYDQFWKDRAIEDHSKVKIPVYHSSSPHRPGALYHWSEFDVPKKIFSFPRSYTDRPYFQAAWEVLRWYDYWLKEIDTGIMEEPKVRIFVEGANEWKTGDDYPFPETRWIPFNLHYNNRMLCEIEPWPDMLSYSYTDAPGDRGFLKYSSAPMVENTEVVGPLALNLYASSRGIDINFFIGLWDVDPEGNEICLTRGWLKGSHRELDIKRSKPYHPVHTHTNPQPLVPGQIYEFNIALFPTANLFEAGHRIVLKISSADDEAEGINEVGMTHLLSQTPNTITIYHNAQYPSHLLLPITRGNIVGTYVSGGDISLEKGFMEVK
ncbi:CocE/NonD family hydrolase [Thermodesulfobacteriota bacterium]